MFIAPEPAPIPSGPVITTRSGDSVAEPAPSVSPYNLALLRLQLLTAVPSFERKHETSWPYAYLEASVRGLAVSRPEANLLQSIAPGLCTGTHSPFPIVQQLMRHLDGPTWEELLADLQQLNAAHPDVVATIVAHVRELRGEAAPPKPPEPVAMPEPVDVSADTQPSTEAKAASRQNHGDAPDSLNERDLGPLDSMFD